jgi:hypothetical protein
MPSRFLEAYGPCCMLGTRVVLRQSNPAQRTTSSAALRVQRRHRRHRAVGRRLRAARCPPRVASASGLAMASAVAQRPRPMALAHSLPRHQHPRQPLVAPACSTRPRRRLPAAFGGNLFAGMSMAAPAAAVPATSAAPKAAPAKMISTWDMKDVGIAMPYPLTGDAHTSSRLPDFS